METQQIFADNLDESMAGLNPDNQEGMNQYYAALYAAVRDAAWQGSTEGCP